MFKWWKERRTKKKALRLMQESAQDLEQCWLELCALALVAAKMAKENEQKAEEN